MKDEGSLCVMSGGWSAGGTDTDAAAIDCYQPAPAIQCQTTQHAVISIITVAGRLAVTSLAGPAHITKGSTSPAPPTRYR